MLEDLKQILKDDSLHLFLGQIKRLHLAGDRSYLKVEVNVWPEDRSIIAEMSWDSVGPESGFYAFPAVGDAVLCCSAEGDADQSYVIKRLSSRADKIPNTATSGDTVLRALSGKKEWLTSDTRVNVSRGDTEPTENLVLGQRMKTTYSDHLGKLITYLEKVIDYMSKFEQHKHIGNAGFYTVVPDNASDVAALRSELETLKTETNSLKSSKVDNEFILSDLSFTEK
jgi:uncharacterized protein involved in type VI secretion and phage assembly